MDLLTPTLGFMRAVHVVALQPLALFFSFFGSEPFYLLLLPLVYWLVDRRTGARLGLLLVASMLFNDLFKTAFHLPRPYWVDPSLTPVSKWGLERSFGFPSGHSQGAFLVWPFLAMQRPNPKKWLPLALIVASCIAGSRLVLGVHWPLDVVGGGLMGGGLTVFYLRFGAAIERTYRGRSRMVQVVVALTVAVLFAVLGVFFVSEAVRLTGPSLAQFGQSAWSLQKSSVDRCAAMLGLIVGLVFAPSDVHAGGTTKQKVLRLLVGFLGLFVFYLGLRSVGHLVVGTFARYFLSTLWVTCGALWAFRALEGRETKRLVQSN